MATAGAIIASAAVEAEDTTAAAETAAPMPAIVGVAT